MAFVRYVTTSMEVQPITFNTYRMIFLQNESLILGIPRIIRDFCRRRGLQSRFAMVFIVLTMLFVLVFPTLGGAMTGYSGNVLSYVPDSDGNYIPFKDFEIAAYTVHDGVRINQTDEFHATLFGGSKSGRSLDQDRRMSLQLTLTEDPSLPDIPYWYNSYKPSLGQDSYARDCGNYTYEDQRSRCYSDQMLWTISQCEKGSHHLNTFC